MKLNKKNKILMFSFLILLSKIYSITNEFDRKPRARNLVTPAKNPAKRTINNNRNTNTIINKYKSYPLKNTLGNFVAGIGEQLVGGNTNFLKCFPDSWKNMNTVPPSENKSTNELGKILGAWVEGVQVFIKMSGPVISFFCKYKEKVINYIQKIFIKKKLRKYRIMFEMGYGKRAVKLLLKKNGWGWGNLVNAIKKGVSSASNFIKNTASKIAVYVKENFIDPIFNNWFGGVKARVLGLIEKIKKFLESNIVQRLQECADSLSGMFTEFKTLFNGLREKFRGLRLAMNLGMPSLIFYVVDMVVALVCNRNDFMRAIEMIVDGIKNNNTNQRFYILGQGIGLIFRTFALSSTLSGNLAIKSKL